VSASTTPFESAFLSGKVLRKSLPAFQQSAGPDAPSLKRLLLPQGELAQFHDGPVPIHYQAYIELRDGTVRGNHYHEVKEEFIYLIQGELQLVIEDIDSKARDSVTLQAGDIAFISTRVAHALKTLRNGHAIEFSKAQFDATDTHRYPLV